MEDIDRTSETPFEDQFPTPEELPQNYDIPGDAVTATEAEGAVAVPDADIPITAPDDHIGEADRTIGDHEPVTALPESEYGAIATDIDRYAKGGRYYGDERWEGDRGYIRAIEPRDLVAEVLEGTYDTIDVLTAEAQGELQYAVSILADTDGPKHGTKAVSFTRTEEDEPRWTMTSDAILASAYNAGEQTSDAPLQGQITEDGSTLLEDGVPMTMGELRKILRIIRRGVEA